jgi:hypothetical protein
MSITMSLMIDPVPMLQTLSSLETPNLAQTHTMLEKTLSGLLSVIYGTIAAVSNHPAST